MASLYEIMREQEDEKLARQLYSQNAAYEKEEELFNSDLSDEELARRLQEQFGGYIEQHMQPKEEKQPVQEETDEELARRLQEEFDRIDNAQQSTEHNNDETAQVDPAEFSLEDDETAALQYEEDERLAYEMQNMERSEVMNVHTRHFNAVEERYASLKPMHFDEDGEEPDDEYYQELEDQDIGYVYRRIPEKMNAQSDEPKALHYQTYSTRNTGKKELKAKKKISKLGRQLIKQFRVKEEGYEYGVVLGMRHDQAYCYDGIVRRVHFYKKVRETTYITRGVLVLLKLRPYQDEIADVVHIYEKDEVSRLHEMGEIAQLDPVLHLPPEVLHTVLEFVNHGQANSPLSLLNKAWNAIVTNESPETTSNETETSTSNFDKQLSRVVWGNLRDFHSRFVRHNVTGGLPHSGFFCGKERAKASETHFSRCGLTNEVLRVAEEVWNELAAWRARPFYDPNSDPGEEEDSLEEFQSYSVLGLKPYNHRDSDEESSDDDEVLGIGLPSDKPRAPKPPKKLFDKNSVLRLKYDDDELINYASTVLWTWWTIHKRKDLDQRPETIEVPIRATLLRMLRRGISTTLQNYTYELRGLEKKEPKYLEVKRQLAAFQHHWQLVINPPKHVEFEDEEDSTDESDYEE